MKILFDCDGTLLDSMHVWVDNIKDLMKKYDFTPTEEQQETIEALGFEEVSEYFAETFAHDMTKDDIIHYFKDKLEEAYSQKVLPKKGIKEKLEELYNRGFEMAIASSTDKKYLEMAFERLGFMKYFQFIITPDTTGLRKNELEYWNKACEMFDSNPDQIALFDDKIYAIRVANKLGITTIGVDDIPYNTDDIDFIKKEANYYVSLLSEFDFDKIA